MSRKRNKCDKELHINWEEVENYDQNFAKDIFDIIDSFIDKENINENFSKKRAKKYQFKRHCLGNEKKISNKNIIYYGCENLERYITFVNLHVLDSNYFEISTLFSLGNKEKVISAFRNFFEGNEYLKIASQCGFSLNNKALTLLLSSLDYKISRNYC